MTDDISDSGSEPKFHSLSLEWEVVNFLSMKDGDVYFSSKSFSFCCDLRLYLQKWKDGKVYRMCVGAVKKSPWEQAMTISARVKTADGTLVKLQVAPCNFTWRTYLRQKSQTNKPTDHSTFTFMPNRNSPPKQAFFELEQKYVLPTLGLVSELVPSGTLTLNLLFENKKSQQKEVSNGPQKLIELETLSANFGDLFIHQKKCDVTLKVQEEEFRAHKAVLVARSPVFAATFEGDTIEKRTGVVTIPDCDPDSFRVFLHYLYTGKAEDISCETGRHLYTTADKYDVPELKSFCVVCMKRKLSAENLCDVVSLADLHEDSRLLSSAQDFFNRNFKDVVATTGWVTLLETNCRLVNQLLNEMASVSEMCLEGCGSQEIYK